MFKCFQATGDGLDGKLDEGSAHLLLDSTPSKVVSSETTVSQFPVSTVIIILSKQASALILPSFLAWVFFDDYPLEL